MTRSNLSFIPIANRSLLWQFARREVLGRYRGSLLGLAWTFILPLMMLGVYSFVFVGVFRARWPSGANSSGGGGGLEFALQVFAGLVIFNLFAEVAGRAPNLIVEQPNLIKKVIFPVELLTWVTILSGLFHLLIGLFSLSVVLLLVRGSFPLTAVALPLVLLPFLPFLLGLGWFLSALGVYLRDVAQMMAMIITFTMFMSPVFYSLSTLDPKWQFWMRLNPLTTIIEQVRAVLLQGLWPDWVALGWYLLLATAFAVAGALFFQATREGFADVL